MTGQLLQPYTDFIMLRATKVIGEEPFTISHHLFGFLSPFQKIQTQSIICAEYGNELTAHSASTPQFSALSTMKKDN